MKVSKVGLVLAALVLSVSVDAKGLLDVLIDKAVDHVTGVLLNDKPKETRAVDAQIYQSCEYVDRSNNVHIIFKCLGEHINGGSEIFIKTDKPIMLSPDFDKTPYQLFKAKQSDSGDWQISVLTESGYEARFSFLNATGSSTGAPERLSFNNGNIDHVLTINLLNPLGD